MTPTLLDETELQTGETIGLERLLLRPTASLCIEAKERQEQREKHQRERDQ
ncbi:DnaK suppressor protein [Pseudomonas benzenivorans]|nr:DnaK suppressor protein [Pseudomonas benzenivorans]